MKLDVRSEMSFEDYVREELAEIKADVKDISEAINGNGHRGMKQTLAAHSTYFKVLGGALVAAIPVGLFIAPHIAIR